MGLFIQIVLVPFFIIAKIQNTTDIFECISQKIVYRVMKQTLNV